MYDDLTSFEKQTHPKNFAKTLTNLKDPKIFQKPQILGQKIWKCMTKGWERIILEREVDLEIENCDRN